MIGRVGAGQVWCASRPEWWDLDRGGPEQWTAAIFMCRSCPRLAACRTDLADQPEPPRSVIWAGIPLSKQGEPMTLSAGGQLRTIRTEPSSDEQEGHADDESRTAAGAAAVVPAA